MNRKKPPYTFRGQEDIMDMLDVWVDNTRVGKGEALQLGAWIVMSLDPNSREVLFKMMDERKKPSILVDSHEELDDEQVNKVMSRLKKDVARLLKKKETG